jgi:hypothetical protein
MTNESNVLITWEPMAGHDFNPEFTGYKAAHYFTGSPELGWCLYSRGAGACWNQRTKEQKAPSEGMKPQQIGGQWFWVHRLRSES